MHILIDKTIGTPMIRQLYQQIQSLIMSGKLHSGEKLPSSRQLATQLNISRIIVTEVYEQLIAEGYLTSKTGSGTYVESFTNLNNYDNTRFSTTNKTSIAESTVNELRHEPNHNTIDFRTGVPDLTLFPIEKWGKLYKDACTQILKERLDYYMPHGSYQLRLQLSNYLYRSRGIVTSPSSIFITTGAAQGFTLLARLLLNPNERVIVEDPINHDIYRMLISTGAQIKAIPVDSKGIITQQLPNDFKGKLIFTTPSHQFPMGSILSAKRRIDLIDYALQSGGYVIEDDYDSAFRYSGNPVSALHTLSSQKVIYVGSFSKVLYPALRMGYVILPDELIEPFKDLKHLEDLHTPILEQITLAKFIEQGMFARHIRRCKKVYHEKNHFLRACLESTFKDRISILGDSTGLHLVVRFDSITFNDDVIHQLAKNGLLISPIQIHTQFPDNHKHHLMIGYAHLTLSDIEKGIQLLSKTIETHKEMQ